MSQQFSKAPDSLYTTQNYIALGLCFLLGLTWTGKKLLESQRAKQRERLATEFTRQLLSNMSSTSTSTITSSVMSPISTNSSLLAIPSSSHDHGHGSKKRRPGMNKGSKQVSYASIASSKTPSPAASNTISLPRVSPVNPPTSASPVATRSIGIQVGPDTDHSSTQTDKQRIAYNFFNPASNNASVYGDVESDDDGYSHQADLSGSPYVGTPASRSRMPSTSSTADTRSSPGLGKPLPSFTEKLRSTNHNRHRSSVSSIVVPPTARPHLEESPSSSSRNASSSTNSFFFPNSAAATGEATTSTSTSSEMESNPSQAESINSSGKKVPPASKRKGSLAKGKWVPGMAKPEQENEEYWTLDPVPSEKKVDANGVRKRNTITRKDSRASAAHPNGIAKGEQSAPPPQTPARKNDSVASLTRENIEAIGSTSETRIPPPPPSAANSICGASDAGLPPYPGMPFLINNMQSPTAMRSASLPTANAFNQQRKESLPQAQLQAQFYQHQQQLQTFLQQQMMLQSQQQYRMMQHQVNNAYAGSQQQQQQPQTPLKSSLPPQSLLSPTLSQKPASPATLMVPQQRPSGVYRMPSNPNMYPSTYMIDSAGNWIAAPSAPPTSQSAGMTTMPPSPSSSYFMMQALPSPSASSATSMRQQQQQPHRSPVPPPGVPPMMPDPMLLSKLEKMEQKMKRYEVDNERKGKELEIAAWRLKCVEVERAAERAAEEKQKHEAISYFVEKAEAAEARIKTLEQQFGLVVQAAEEELTSDRDRSGSFSLSDRQSHSSGSPKGRGSPILASMDTSLTGQSTSYYASPTATAASYSYSSFHGSPTPTDLQMPPYIKRSKSKKSRNHSYRSSPGNQNGTFHSPSLNRARSPRMPVEEFDSDEEDPIILLSTAASNTPYMGNGVLGRSSSSFNGDAEENPPIVGLGFDVGNEMVEEQAEDCETLNYCGSVPTAFLKKRLPDEDSTPIAHQSPVDTIKGH